MSPEGRTEAERRIEVNVLVNEVLKALKVRKSGGFLVFNWTPKWGETVFE